MAKIKETFKKMFRSNAHRKADSNTGSYQLPPPSVRGPSAAEGSTGTLEPASATISAEQPILSVEPPTLPAEPSPEHVDSPKRTDLEELWEIALGRFSKEGGSNLPPSVAQTSLEDCLSSFQQTVDVFERKTEEKEKVRDGIKAILEGIEAASGLLGEGVSIAFPPAKTIFTAVGMLAKAGQKTIKKYDLMLELLHEIGAFVDRMNVHKNNPISDEIKKIILSFLSELLKAIVALSTFMEANIAVSFLKEVRGQDEDINGAIKKMARLAAQEAGMVGALTNRNVKKIMERQEDAQEQKLREKIRNWLSPPDPSTNHEFNRAARRGQEAGQETGHWFLRSPGFIAWRDERSSRPLWLYGKPGNGKSVLCSTVIDNIKAHCKVKPSSALAYFYFDFRDQAKLNLRGLLCSLIVQMLSQCSTMPASIANLFSEHANSGMTAPIDHLEHVFSGLLDLFEHSYVVIDALDEPSRDMRKTELLPFLDLLIRKKCPSLHLMVTSRPESDIQLSMESLDPSLVDLSTGLVEDDIKMCIRRFLDQDMDFKLWDAEFLDSIELSLTERANGM
ncbi:uncharacterized protein STEHIDRAFT_110908 [Stereum hirsutum FP-91666 SS1]|uniref:uncharacterized protein n=1 Tax=Stereum hirsutum (strain FP-91666) TaxID=721885 RepID=UPI000440E8CB|nr:uncharacterized protein STEHIDRAFT_110908 [Stereum hirsutum FP-91666 SS1]EIM86386.1 hypothetical protein STEHIDRAFT_110908 [Stereum hirsutum FP-91666 SS1]